MGIERLNEFWPEWRVTDVLGSGAFGRVYKAVDEEAGFPVYSAIKVISIPASEAELDALESEGMSESESRTYFKGIVDDFVNEIKLMTTLKGAPNIVAVEAFKIAEEQGRIGWDIFIRMELLTSFKEYLKSHTPTEAEVVKMAIDIATALETCQKRNIIHRDIKPANIFIDDFDNFKLGDFGIAKELEKTTGAVSAKGTFSYMAPEVARGQRYDNTVDIYSLGLVMYSLLNNNRPPFVDPYKNDVSYNERKAANDRRLAGEPLPPPCNASSGLADIILMSCSYDPAQRFKSAAAFKNALKGYKNIVKAPVTPPEVKPDMDETVAVARKPAAYKVENGNVNKAADNGIDFGKFVKKSEPKEPEAIRNPELNPHVKRDIQTDIDFSGVLDKKNVPDKKRSTNKPVVIISIILVIAITLGVCWKAGLFSTGIKDLSKAEIITFGLYEQDNNTSNGAEQIEWIVLDKKGGKALVISKYALDCQPYNEEYASVTWEESDIRAWLNDDFYNTAFSESERSEIETTYVVNDDNAEYGTDGGNDTSDKIFLLSIAEAEEYFSSDEARECEPTKYAVAEGAYENSDDGNCWWWLRSPGSNSDRAADILTYGGVLDYGNYVDFGDDAVRPALWIDLES